MFSLLTKTKKEQSSVDNHLVDDIYAYLSGLVNNKDLIKQQEQKYQEIRGLPVKQKEIAFIPVYLAIEDVILGSNPPDIKKSYYRDLLRQEVKSNIKWQDLHTPLSLIFLSGSSYYISLFRVGIYNLVSYIVSKKGADRLKSVVEKCTKGTILEPAQVNVDGIDFNPVIRSGVKASPGEIINAFKSLYGDLYHEIISISSLKQANQVVQQSFDFFRHHYDYETISYYLKVLPVNLLEHERIAFLSQDELRKKANLTELEKEKRVEAEKLASEYQQKLNEINDTKTALINVLEDSRELEKTLARERDQARAIISSMAEGLIVVDGNQTITIMNKAAENLLEISKDNLIGKKFPEAVKIFVKDREILDEESTFHMVLHEGKSIVVGIDQNHYYMTLKGRKFPVYSTTAPLMSEEKIIGAVKIFRDATSEKESKMIIEQKVDERTRELQEKNIALEKARQKISEGWYDLQQEKARLTASIHSLSLGFILTDARKGILDINPRAMKILDLKRLPENLSEIGFFSIPENITRYDRCYTENKLVEVRDILYQGKYFHLYFTPISLSAEKNENIGTAIVIEDITEAKIIERSKDEFFSIASHELRTPLTAIRGNTSMINEYYQEQMKDPELKEIINDIHESSIRLINIVNDFLDTSRLEMGKMVFNNVPCDISEIINDVIKEYQVTGSERKLYIEYHRSDKELPKIFADTNKLKQVLINLVGNALKFTDQGGVTISADQVDKAVEVQVVDTGKGIPVENQSLLFHKFQQAGESLFTRDTTKGTGLGLYISKLIMEGMGGKIYLKHSEVGKGSVFVFTLQTAQ